VHVTTTTKRHKRATTINIEHHERDLTITTKRHSCATTSTTTSTQQVDFRW
jgi:hypothetical protein